MNGCAIILGIAVLGFDPGAGVLAYLNHGYESYLHHPSNAAGLDGEIVYRAMDACGEQALPCLIQIIRNGRWDARVAALKCVGLTAPANEDVVQCLLDAAKHERPDVCLESLGALRRVGAKGSSVAPVLVGLLRNSDWRIRSAAAGALGSAGIESDEIIARLSDLLEDEHPQVCLEAEAAICKCRGNLKSLVPKLIELLNADEAEIRIQSAILLTECGPDAAGAVPSLIAVLKRGPEVNRRDASCDADDNGDADDADRTGEADALSSFSSSWSAIFTRNARVRPVRPEDDALRLLAIRALGRIGPSAEVCVPLLHEGLMMKLDYGDWGLDWKRPSKQMWANAAIAVALAQIGSEAKVALPRMEELAKKYTDIAGWAPENYYTSAGKVYALSRIVPAIERISSRSSVAGFVRFLGNQNLLIETAGPWNVRDDGWDGPKFVDPLQDENIPALVKYFQADDRWVRLKATRVLHRNCPKNETVVSELTPLLAHQDGHVRVLAGRFLQERGVDGRTILPALLPLLTTNDLELIRQTAYLAPKLDPEGDAVVPALVSALTHDDRSTRRIICHQFEKYPHHHAIIVPAVEPLLRHKDWQVRSNAVNTLRKIGPNAKRAVPQLKEMARKDRRVGSQARRALGVIEPESSTGQTKKQHRKVKRITPKQ